jgi:hypothetical protein
VRVCSHHCRGLALRGRWPAGGRAPRSMRPPCSFLVVDSRWGDGAGGKRGTVSRPRDPLPCSMPALGTCRRRATPFIPLRECQTDGCWRMQAAIFVVIVDAAAGFVALPLPSARPVGAQGMQMAAGCATDAALSRRMVLRSAAAALVLGEHGGGRGWLRRRAYLCESPATCPKLHSSETLLDVFCALRRRRRAKGACGREGRG